MESGFQAKHRVPWHSMGCWCRESELLARTGRLSSQTAWEPLRDPQATVYAGFGAIGPGSTKNKEENCALQESRIAQSTVVSLLELRDIKSRIASAGDFPL
jgi:hypothetical protein